jgi:hypothetical protein
VPPEFQIRLTRLFGLNPFGEPNIKIVWGQSLFLKKGKEWTDSSGNQKTGYREDYQCSGLPCWVIVRWQSPEIYGSPAAYYQNSWMELTETWVCGEYPWTGRYEIIQPLIHKEYVNGKLEIDHFPLSHYLIDTIIPMIESFRRLSAEQLKVARAVTKAAEAKAETEFVADMLEHNMPTWLGPHSYTGQGIKTSVLARKEAQIQRVWDHWAKRGRPPQFARGMAQGDRPRLAH